MKQLLKPLFWCGSLRRIWILLFLCTAVSAFLLQLVVLPYWLKGLHAGNGLLVGGDWIGFHRIAVELSEKIILQGWGAWELRPERQSPAGIAAALYVLFGPHPWVLVPLNAAVHASTGVLLIRIVQPLVPDLRYAVLCVLPFVFFPSALVWYAQIHKDGAFFLGIFLCLYGWILLSRLETWTGRYTQVLFPLLYLFGGCFLIWVMRPYGVKLMQGMGCIFAMVLAPHFFVAALQKKLRVPQALLALAIVVALPVALDIFKDRAANGEVTLVTNSMLNDVRPTQTPESVGEEERRGSFAIRVDNTIAELRWKKTDWLPDFLDNAFLTLAIVRSGYAGTKGGSNIDADLMFRSAPEFLPYLPRAIQIGFTAPFPTSWFEQGTSSGATFLRRISAMEMIFVYAALIFLPFALWQWRRSIEFWLIFAFCSILLLLYTYITPNIGSLYRSRHGFLMLLLALGIAGAIALRQRSKSARSSQQAVDRSH